MKIVSAVLGLVVLVLLAVLFFEHTKTAELESSLVTLSRDRETMTGALQKLEGRVAELQQRAVAAAATAPRVETAANPAAAVAVAATVAPVARPGATMTAPAGWGKNGSKPGAYVVGVDTLQTWGGMPSAYVQSLDPTPNDFGGMMQTMAADNYTGKRVRLSGWIKTEDANDGGGHLWLRVDGQERGQALQFDNMNNRAVKGTSDWQEGSVVLDVPAGASALAYGFFVQGGGKMWVSGTKIEEVGSDVPSTNMLPPKKALPKAPTNLGFYPDPPK
jgi:hypothetical protein